MADAVKETRLSHDLFHEGLPVAPEVAGFEPCRLSLEAALALSRRPQASGFTGAVIASSRSRLAAGHRAFMS